MIAPIIRKFLHSFKSQLKINPDRFLQEISGLIHVGANIGQERHMYNELGLNVIWIEPIPEIFKILKQNLEEVKSQRAFQYLVTDCDDREYQFHIANNSGASSSILDLKQHKDVWPSVNYVSTIPLKSITLASLIQRECIDLTKYQALIMDTQGSELLVLKGAIPLLHNFKYIKTEAPDFESYSNCCKLDEINSFMMQYGYKEYSRHEFARRSQGGSYYDIVYKENKKIRKRLKDAVSSIRR